MAEATLIETEPDASAGGALATALSVPAILRHYELVQNVLKQIMKEGTHYGASFPGDKKVNLLKPGADALCLAFQLAPEYAVEQTNLPNGHREVSVVCKLRTPAGRVIGQGVGTCSTMESKYRYRNAQRKCPACGIAAIIKTNKGRNPGGYWCVPDKGGCGANYNPGAPEIEQQECGKVENPDPADQFNTVLKIGKKRAHVDATITATAASDLFHQDLEDIAERADIAERKEEAKRPAAAPAAQQPGTDRHTKEAPAQPPKSAPTAATPATKAATPAGSTTDAMRPATMANTSDCEKWIVHTRKAIGNTWASAVWKHTSVGWQVRFDTLREITVAVEEIRRVVGDAQADQMVDGAFGNVDLSPDSIQEIRRYLVKASHGEVANVEHQQPAAAGAPKDDEPPF